MTKVKEIIKNLEIMKSANIEMTERKVFASGGIKQFEVLKMCDCSTVTGDQLFPINGKQYYAIDNNTLMEV